MFSEIWTGADEEKQKKKHKSEGKNHKKKVIKFWLLYILNNRPYL